MLGMLFGQSTQIRRHLRVFLLPALVATEARIGPHTHDSRAFLSQPRLDHFPSPAEHLLRLPSIAIAVLQGNLRYKGSALCTVHLRGRETKLSDLLLCRLGRNLTRHRD